MEYQSWNEEVPHRTIQEKLNHRDKQERLGISAVRTETLYKLNVSIDALPQKCQQLLQTVAECQVSLDIDELDPVAISLLQSKEISIKLDDEYKILHLTQKNAQLQAKIDRNKKHLEELRRELASSKDSLMLQSPNPENVQDHIRQLRQKVASYEENCEKAKAKFAKLSVPDTILPNSLAALSSQLATLRATSGQLQARAEDVTLAREARDAFVSLSR